MFLMRYYGHFEHKRQIHLPYRHTICQKLVSYFYIIFRSLWIYEQSRLSFCHYIYQTFVAIICFNLSHIQCKQICRFLSTTAHRHHTNTHTRARAIWMCLLYIHVVFGWRCCWVCLLCLWSIFSHLDKPTHWTVAYKIVYIWTVWKLDGLVFKIREVKTNTNKRKLAQNENSIK